MSVTLRNWRRWPKCNLILVTVVVSADKFRYPLFPNDRQRDGVEFTVTMSTHAALAILLGRLDASALLPDAYAAYRPPINETHIGATALAGALPTTMNGRG